MIKEIQTASPEELRDIPGLEGLYMASDQGNIYSLNYNKMKIMRKMRLNDNLNGYKSIMIVKNKIKQKFLVHRLVAKTFPDICGEWFEGCQVNHLNECKWDNRAINLRTCTVKENVNYGTGPQRRALGCSKPVGCRKNGVLMGIFINARVAQNCIKGSNYKTISACCNGKVKTHCGYEWFFI